MARVLQHRVNLVANDSTLLSSLRVTDGTNSGSGGVPVANEWHFTNVGSGTVTVTPHFGTGTSHTGYTVPSNDSIIIDLCGMTDWLIAETGGVSSSSVTVVGFFRD